jgi:hypothetical protein
MVLILRYEGTMDMWHPILLSKLAENHIVIVFNNRVEVGNNTLGEKNYSIE